MSATGQLWRKSLKPLISESSLQHILEVPYTSLSRDLKCWVFLYKQILAHAHTHHTLAQTYTHTTYSHMRTHYILAHVYILILIIVLYLSRYACVAALFGELYICTSLIQLDHASATVRFDSTHHANTCFSITNIQKYRQQC